MNKVRTLAVFKAQPIGDDCAPDLSIVATEVFPGEVDRDMGDALHDDDAARIVTALLATLPGGTIDRILIKLLKHQASRLRVRYR